MTVFFGTPQDPQASSKSLLFNHLGGEKIVNSSISLFPDTFGPFPVAGAIQAVNPVLVTVVRRHMVDVGNIPGSCVTPLMQCHSLSVLIQDFNGSGCGSDGN